MGLLRGMARTAVVAGTATAVSNRVSRRQARRWGGQDVEPYQPEPDPYYAQQQAPPPPPAPAAAPAQVDVIQELKDLAGLHDQGVLTDEEFAAQKAKILA